MRWAVLNILCLATDFHRAVAVPLQSHDGISAENVADSFRKFWIEAYGSPDFILTDEGPENIGEPMRKLTAFYNITQKAIAGGAPWQNGKVERHGGVLKDIILKDTRRHFSSLRGGRDECCPC